jgi:ketosteroid isomerase-like protein
MLRRFASGDIDGWVALYAEDYLLVEHRKLGWVETDKPGHRAITESMFSTALDVRNEVDEVFAGDDRVIAFSSAFRGHAPEGGGEFEIPSGLVMVVEDGLVQRVDRFEPEDRAGMLARYAELAGSRPAVLGDRPPERAVARLCRRWTTGHLDELVALFTDDVVRVDHRTLGYEQAHGRNGIRETYLAMFGVSDEVRIEPREVLACDERVLVLRATLRGTAAQGGGQFATPCGYLFVVTDGRIERLEQFEPDARQAMIARYTQLGGGQEPLGDRPAERWIAEYAVRRFTLRDLEGFVEGYADDVVMIDHQKLGWTATGVTDKQSVRNWAESIWSASLDSRFDVDKVVACDERMVVCEAAIRGHSVDGGGAFEIANISVYVVQNEQLRRVEVYAPDDPGAALARFAELGEGGAR